MSAKLRMGACALAVSGLLSSCGGGGTAGDGAGGGGGGPLSTLAFTTANAGQVASYPLWAGHLMLRIGQTVTEEIAAAATQASAAATTVTCNSGTLQRRWVDNNGNGTMDAGDEITLDFATCTREPLEGSANGRITVVIDQLADGGDLVARVVLAAPGLMMAAEVGTPGASDHRVSGQMRVEVSHSKLRHTLLIGGDNDDAMAFDFPAGGFAADRITNFRFKKAHHWDEARTVVDIRMRYDSPELGGGFDVSMPAPLRNWLDELPEPGPQQGSFLMRGRNGALVKVAVGDAGNGPSDLLFTLDIAGDGSVDDWGEGSWADIGWVSSVYFADYTPGGRGTASVYDANEFSLRPPITGVPKLPVDTSFSVQFTRPVAGADAWHWQLLDQGRLDQMPTAGVEVPVQVELQGALFLVKPVQPLRYSHRYKLRVDTGEDDNGNQVMRATTGGVLSQHEGTVGSFMTPDVLSPRSSLSSRLTLVAGESVEAVAVPPWDDAPADIHYLWTQISGTPLTIDSPNERSTLMGLAPGASGVGSATVRLTVSMEGAGNSESEDFVLRTVANTSDAWVSRLRIPTTVDWDSVGPPKELWSGPAVGALTAVQQGARLSLTYTESADPTNPDGDWSLELASADGQALRPGTYTDVYSSSWDQRPIGVPTLDLMIGLSLYSSVQGEFVIHELEVDGTGGITRLALDFTTANDSGPRYTSGSIRINSAQPLPP